MVAIGQADGIPLTVVYTDRVRTASSPGEFISTRRSNRRERTVYAEAAEG